MSPTRHLDAEALYHLLDGQLPAALERAAEAHLCRCATCRELREECAATLSALRWYAAAPPAPPTGYWEAFWRALPIPGIPFDAEIAAGALGPATPSGTSRSLSLRRATMRRYAPVALAASLAAVVALGAGMWWIGDAPVARPPSAATFTAHPPTAAAAMPSGDQAWEDDWAFFERVSYAIGSVDPLSKGVALAGLAEASREAPVGP